MRENGTSDLFWAYWVKFAYICKLELAKKKNEWYSGVSTNMENKQNFMTIKADHVGSSYWEMSKQNDEKAVGSIKNSLKKEKFKNFFHYYSQSNLKVFIQALNKWGTINEKEVAFTWEVPWRSTSISLPAAFVGGNQVDFSVLKKVKLFKVTSQYLGVKRTRIEVQ